MKRIAAISLLVFLETVVLVGAQSPFSIPNNDSSNASTSLNPAPSTVVVSEQPSTSILVASSSAPAALSSLPTFTSVFIPDATMSPVTSSSAASSSVSSSSVSTSTLVSSSTNAGESSTSATVKDSSVASSAASSRASSSEKTTASSPPASTTPFVYHERIKPPKNNWPENVAIICGCLLSLMTVLLFTGIGLVLKHVKVTEMNGKPVISRRSQGDAAFYEGLHPQSAQFLVGSMSNQSFAASPSDQHLNASYGQSSYFNRGYELDQHPGGAHSIAVHFEKEPGGTGPIEIKGGRKDQVTFVESKA